MNETDLRDVDAVRQHAVTAERSAREAITLLRDLADRYRGQEALRFAFTDAEHALTRIRRARVLLEGIQP